MISIKVKEILIDRYDEENEDDEMNWLSRKADGVEKIHQAIWRRVHRVDGIRWEVEWNFIAKTFVLLRRKYCWRSFGEDSESWIFNKNEGEVSHCSNRVVSLWDIDFTFFSMIDSQWLIFVSLNQLTVV